VEAEAAIGTKQTCKQQRLRQQQRQQAAARSSQQILDMLY
jgi:hypothetical protein